MDVALHLPLMRFGDEELSLTRLTAAVDAARECGFAAVSANDHFLFQTPWLDGPVALAAAIERSGSMDLATTVTLAVLRGPVPLAKTLAAIDVLSGGRVVAAVGPGSSAADYEAIGVPFDERWARFDEAIAALRALLDGVDPPGARHYRLPAGVRLEPEPARRVPIWIGSWGSPAGLARTARAGDGWLASAYNTDPARFAEARARLDEELERRGRDPETFPDALSTMWTWISDDRADADRVLRDVLAPLLRRDPDELRQQVCVGSPEHCADLVARYAEAGCGRVYFWPLGDEARQVERIAGEVAPRLS